MWGFSSVPFGLQTPLNSARITRFLRRDCIKEGRVCPKKLKQNFIESTPISINEKVNHNRTSHRLQSKRKCATHHSCKITFFYILLCDIFIYSSIHILYLFQFLQSFESLAAWKYCRYIKGNCCDLKVSNIIEYCVTRRLKLNFKNLSST